MKIDEETWRLVQHHFGFDDEEMIRFKEDPRNADIVSKVPELMNKIFVAEVVSAHGCYNRHEIGQKIYLDAAGNLITGLCPEKMCVHLMNPLAMCVFSAQELLYAGIDPNEMRFKRFGCFDVGLQCGGWGHVVLEIRTENRE